MNEFDNEDGYTCDVKGCNNLASFEIVKGVSWQDGEDIEVWCSQCVTDYESFMIALSEKEKEGTFKDYSKNH